MTTLEERAQQREVGVEIELFSIDLTSVGGDVQYFTPSRPNAAYPINFGGISYRSVDIEATGFEKTSTGTQPRPQLSCSNADNVIGALLIAYGDLLGCKVTRTKTLSEFLDDYPGADPTKYWPQDIYRVDRKISQNRNQVVLELAPFLDAAAVKIPRGVVLRATCPLIYRVYKDGGFDYSKATCPYVGASYFLRNGSGTPRADMDSCGKRETDCKSRFGATNQLPFGGFPGVGRQ